jgi:hypothetical protein
MNPLTSTVIALLTSASPASGTPAPEPGTPPDPPACTLTAPELRSRITDLERNLLPRVREIQELPDGYRLLLPNEDGQLRRIADFVELESRCCAFLDFEIALAARADDVSLTLTGPEDTKDILRPLLAAADRPR